MASLGTVLCVYFFFYLFEFCTSASGIGIHIAQYPTALILLLTSCLYYYTSFTPCSYNEFLYAISGGDLSHSIISGGAHSHHGSHSPLPQPQDNSHLLIENLRVAPPILHLDQLQEGSFVASLKKRISVSAML